MPLVAVLWTALVAAAASLSPALAQDSAGTVVVVFDGSNSMNGRIPGDTANAKHVLVREALRSQLPKIAGARIGLAAFGHRRASDCTDAAMVVAPSSDTQPLMAELERFRPRGFSPVALALREAASALADTPGSVGMLLVLDDLASCRAEDPCAAATDLVAKNPRLTISALGLALNPAAAERMTCLATASKGRFVNVQDVRELEAAMESMLLSTVKLTPPAATPARPGATRSRPTTVAAEVPVPTSPGLYLSLRLGAQGPLLDRPAYWRVMRDQDASDTAPAELEQASGMLELAPGRYRVDVSVAGIERSSTVDLIANQPTQLSVALDAGLVNVAVRLSKGGPPAVGALITAVPANENVGPSRTSLVARIAEEGLLLPAGNWRIVGELGLARTERTVAVKAGELMDVDLSLDAGRLSLSADPLGGGLRYTVSEDDPDSPEGRKEIARSAAAAPSFVLPAGAYNLSVRRGIAETRERVRLQPGDDIRRRVSLGSARIRVASRLPGAAGSGTAPPVSTRVIRVDGADREIARSTEPEAVFLLAPGRYRVEARLGGQNAVARRDIEVRTDAEQRIVLDHAAGTVQLRVAGTQSGLQFGEVFWTILDQAGQVIWQTGQSEPLIVLSAGRYVARVEARGSQYERTFDVRVGDATRLELGG
jgi:Ca-activated chloride channel family protein